MPSATENTGTAIESHLSKVPQVTLVFWIIKILCTTLGETAGDAVTMSMNLGYLVGTAIFAAFFLVAVAIQVKAKKFNPVLYWTTIIATTTVGTTLADFVTRSIGIGYLGGSTILLSFVIGAKIAGPLGAVFAIPVLGIIGIIFRELGHYFINPQKSDK